MENLIKAISKAMSEIENVEKNLNVGTGTSSYKGVADKDVRSAMRKILINNDLVMIPVEIEPKVTVTEWEETTQYGAKHRTQVLTEVLTKYNLIHGSGESIIVCGYGHGVDSQDKSAGKATTYALKYALLNTFLVPTGDIDDTDNTHSDTYAQPPKTAQKTVLQKATATPSPLTAKCPLHNVMMNHYENADGEWWSHKVGDKWCDGKRLK
jgi:hypothetical protein